MNWIFEKIKLIIEDEDIKEQLEDVYLVGNHPILGSWNPKLGICLSKKLETRIVLPVGVESEYKFVCQLKNGLLRWEDGENRRTNSSSLDTVCFLRLEISPKERMYLNPKLPLREG